MRLFPRQLLSSMNPVGRVRAMGGGGGGGGETTGRRKWIDFLRIWIRHRGFWRKSRKTTLTLVFITMMLWLFLISILNLESRLDRYPFSANSDLVYSPGSKLITKRIIQSGHSSWQPRAELSYSNSKLPDIVVEFPETRENNIVGFQNVIEGDFSFIGEGKKSPDLITKRKRILDDRFDIIRKIPGRRIQEMSPIKSGGLENRKASNWIGSRSTAEVSGRKNEPIASAISHGETNTGDLAEDHGFYETRNMAYGKLQERFLTTSSFSSYNSAFKSATDANAVERETSRITPGSISTFHQPTNWRKFEKAWHAPVLWNSISEKMPSKQQLSSQQLNSIHSPGGYVNKMGVRSNDKITTETSSIIKTDNLDWDSPKIIGELTDVNNMGRSGGKVLKIDMASPQSVLKSHAHQPQIRSKVGLGSTSNNKLEDSESDNYIQHIEEVKDIDSNVENGEREKLIKENRGNIIMVRISDKLDVNKKGGEKTMNADDSINRLKSRIDVKFNNNNNNNDKNDNGDVLLQGHRSSPISSFYKSELPDRSTKTNSFQAINSRSEDSIHTSSRKLSSSTFSTSSSSTTKPARIPFPDSPNLGMKNEVDKSYGSLNSRRADENTRRTTSILVMTTNSDEKNAAKRNNGFFPSFAAFIRVDTSDKKITNHELKKKSGLREEKIEKSMNFPERIKRNEKNKASESGEMKIIHGKRNEGKIKTIKGKVEREVVMMMKLGDENKTKKSDISRDDSVNSRQLINVTELAGNRMLMMSSLTSTWREGRSYDNDGGDDSVDDSDDHFKKRTDGTFATKQVLNFKRKRNEPVEFDGFVKYAYNVTASDVIGSKREILDTRPPGCAHLPAYEYSRINVSNIASLPKASVVICFHNEALSVLLRTLQSLLDRTPPHLIDKIILVDDYSSDDDLIHWLPQHIKTEFGSLVTITRTRQREGLVRARLLGSSLVRSEVIVFLDAHVECNVGWLEPLLFELNTPGIIKVVSPYIDTIKADNFEYRRSPAGLQGGFNWRLEFGWRAAPSDWQAAGDGTQPIRTPVISGGLFAVRRDTFQILGGYDSQLEIWGGENFELSFKTWMCGGSMAILPCSRVGHVFRATLPYTFKNADRERTVLRNLGRVAAVWMDEYAEVFEAAVNFPHDLDIGFVRERQELRNGLQCKPFQWYLREINPQLEVVSPATKFYGQVKNKGSLMCLDVVHSDVKRAPVILQSACKGNVNQTLHLTTQRQLKIDQYCIIPGPNKSLVLASCVQNFTWIFVNQQIRPTAASNLCITSVDNELVQLLPCGQIIVENPSKSQSTSNQTDKSINFSKSDYNNMKNSVFNEDSLFFQQWEFQYSFHWKRKRR